MGAFLIREVAEAVGESEGDEAPLVDVIQRIRDEVSVLAVQGNLQLSRELALILTRLDEARLWGVEYSLKRRDLILVDKRKYSQDLDATADLKGPTVATVTTDTGSEP